MEKNFEIHQVEQNENELKLSFETLSRFNYLPTVYDGNGTPVALERDQTSSCTGSCIPMCDSGAF